MRMQTATQIIISTFRRNPGQSVYLTGAPGLGKTSLAYDVAEQLELPKDRVLLFRPSLRDPVDLMGVPSVKDGHTQWNPPAELAAFKDGTGPGMILWDELPQAVTQMQNAAAGALLDWELGPLKLDRRVVQIATGNRTQDKAGANRVVSQLGNRVLHLELEAHLDDWCKWAFAKAIDPLLIAFLRLRSNLLHDFDPDRLSNPTPRSWEMVHKACDPSLERGVFLMAVQGLVGEGAGAEYVAFRDTASKMPNIDSILINPTTERVPEDPGVLYAVCTALAVRATKDNFDRVIAYLSRLPVEFSTMAVKDALMRDQSIASTSAFNKWCVANADVFC